MAYKALVFDLDGTAIPKRPDGMPSAAVIEAVQKAQQLCHVSIATGRPYQLCTEILEVLAIDDLCIVNGGSHIYSRKQADFVWKKEIDQPQLASIFNELTQFAQYQVADEKRLARVPISQYRTDEAVALACIFATQLADAQEIFNRVSRFDNVTAHICSSWQEGAFDVHISHQEATKKHALRSLLDTLDVTPDEVMVVGDGGNDIPLFEGAGWRVAMGNAEEELKARADWVAPHVDEDGLAVAINRFILEQ